MLNRMILLAVTAALLAVPAAADVIVEDVSFDIKPGETTGDGKYDLDRVELQLLREAGSTARLAAKIEREAENKAAGVVAKARAELREEASRLAVELAEDMLKKQVSADDQKRLVEEYMQKMGELH